MPNLYENNAELYDTCLSNRRLNEDIRFYLERAASADGPVLEMCCGTGRVLMEIARAGFTIDGIDLSESMMSVLERKVAAESDDVRGRIGMYLQDMRELSMPGRYGLIIMPFNSFMFLIGDDDISMCLGRIKEHLLPGGRFVFQIHCSDRLGPIVPGTEDVLNTAVLENGDVVRYVDVPEEMDEKRQTVTSSIRHDIYRNGHIIESTKPDRIVTRHHTRDQIRGILERNGFTIESILGDFDGSEYEEGDDTMVITAYP